MEGGGVGAHTGVHTNMSHYKVFYESLYYEVHLPL